MAKLVISRNDTLLGSRFIENTRITIGRASGNTIQLDDPAVSKLHAQVEVVGNDHILIDLGSANGTFVNGERVLLARGAGWPAGARSVLAGFVEAGESLEACVVREIREEVGITVRDVRYLGSQPWPFPRSIMLGFAARADRDAPLKLAEGEIETARWFTRDEIRDAFARADRPPKEGDAELRLPTNSSIARLMLESWAAAEP